jgi:Cu-Zn family superoxide dismutase
MAIRRLGVLATALLLGLVLGLAGTAAAPPPDAYILPGDEVFPEGITVQRTTSAFFVSSTTDGTIFRGHISEPEAEVFLPGNQGARTTATGLEAIGTRLYISGGASGYVFVHDAASGELLAELMAGPGFINDVAVTRFGDAFFTNSLVPVLYRVYQDEDGEYVIEEWLNFEDTVIEYVQGFNLNGIIVTPDQRYLIVVQSNTGRLFRIEIATQAIVEIDLGGIALTAGDGLAMQGHTLYVVRNSLGEIAVVQLYDRFTTGEVVDTITDPSFRFPTTADIARGRLLVVNSQFNQRGGTPELPFTVSAVALGR